MIFEILEKRSQLEKGEEGSNTETAQLAIHLTQVYTQNFFMLFWTSPHYFTAMMPCSTTRV
jgi:hypothetical protein